MKQKKRRKQEGDFGKKRGAAKIFSKNFVD